MSMKIRSSWYKPPSLSWRPYRLQDSAENEYVAWLAKERQWDIKRAREYALAQPHGRVLSAQWHKDDAIPAVVTRKPKATSLSDRARAFALILVEEFSRDHVDAPTVAHAIIGLREALR